MKINENDVRKFLITLFISVIFMTGLYFAVTSLSENKNIQAMLQDIHIRADAGAEEIQESISGVTDDIKEVLDEYIGSFGQMLNEINIDLDVRELHIASTYYKTFLITSEPSVDHIISTDTDGKIFNISAPKYLDSKVCIYIPQELFENQKIDLNINTTGLVSVKDIDNALNDTISVKTTDGVITANNLRCEQIDLCSTDSPVVASYCRGNIARYKSEKSSVTFDGEYNEVSVVAAKDIIANMYSDTNRIDMNTSNGNVTLYLNDTEGFNLTLTDCKGSFYSEYLVELSELSKYGSVVYNYGTHPSQIYISDAIGEINIYKYMEKK